tara:strand:+ start:2092 stop:2313 length:222 start_codon:yes stop_codon:yes gene_type:complete
MMTQKGLKLLKGLIAYHRAELRYWDSIDEIDYNKTEAYNSFFLLDEWLKVSKYIEQEDDLLLILNSLDNNLDN